MKLLVEIYDPNIGINMNQYPLVVLRVSVRFSFTTIPQRGKFRVCLAFSFCFDPTVWVITWGWSIWYFILSHRGLGHTQWIYEFLLCSNNNAGEITDLLHYSPNLKICSNQIPPSHREADRLSSHHVYYWLCWSWWKKECIKNKTIHRRHWRWDIFQEAEKWWRWRGHNITIRRKTQGLRGGRADVGVEEGIQHGGIDLDKPNNIFPL